MSKLLLVCDEDTVREVFRDLFKTQHEIVEAENFDDGFDLFDREKDSLDLVFALDWIGESNLKFIQHIYDADPTIPVILVTNDISGLSEIDKQHVRILGRYAGLKDYTDAVQNEIAQRPERIIRAKNRNREP